MFKLKKLKSLPFYFQFLIELGLFKGSSFFKSLILGFLAIITSILWPVLLGKTLYELQNNSLEVQMFYLPISAFTLSQIFQYYHYKSNLIVIDDFSIKMIEYFRNKILNVDWLTFKQMERINQLDVFLILFWRIRGGLHQFLEFFIPNIIISLALCLVTIYWSPFLFFIFIAFFLLFLLVNYIMVSKTSIYVDNFHDSWRKQTSMIDQFLDQFLLIKLHRNEVNSEHLFLEDTNSFLEDNTTLLLQKAKMSSFIQSVNLVSKIFLIGFGIYLVEKDIMLWSELIFIFFLLNIIQARLTTIPTSALIFLDGYFSFLKIKNTLSLNNLKIPSPSKNNKEFKQIETIRFKDLSLKLKSTELFINLSLDFKRGNLYLIRGGNGNGKTTLIEIILGLIQPDKGTVVVNDENIDFVDYSSLKYSFSYVPQKTNLFSGSINENLLFGNNNKENTAEFNKLWLSVFNDQHRTLSDRGSGLSGGESKRLLILRELLYTSQLIIFDEPENDLDDEGILDFINVIKKIKKDKIVIIVSHSTAFDPLQDFQIDL